MKSVINLFCLSLLLFLQYSTSTFAQNEAIDSTQTLFLLEENGKYGLMDEEGKVWLKPKFDEIVHWNYQESASEALYRKGKRPIDGGFLNFDNQFQHMDKNLLFLRGSPYDHTVSYEQGKLLAKEGAKCYYLNEKGKALFDTFYENATLFDKGIAAVQQKGKVGVIDSTGQFIVPPKFRNARIIFNGDVIHLEDTLRNLHKVDRKGQIISYEEFRTKDKYSFLNAHIFLFKDKNGKLGLQDTSTQRIIVPPIYDRAKSSRKGTAFVLEGKKWKLIDTTGQQVLEETFDRVTYFTRGWAGVWANEMANFINPKGEFLSENWFHEIKGDGFSQHYAQIEAYDCQAFYKADSLQNVSNDISQQSLEVFENCQWEKALIDTMGKIRLTYDELEFCPNKTYPISTIRRGNRWGILNQDLEIVIEPQYQQIILTGNNDLHFVQMPDDEKGEKGLWGLIDSQNNFLAQPQFDQIFYTSNGKALNIKKDGKSGIMDFTGTIIIPPIYDKISGLCELHCSPNSHKDYYQVQQDRKTALFDKKGNIIIDFDNEYEEWDFRYMRDFIKVKVNDKWGLIDFKGNWKISPKYDSFGFLSPSNQNFVTVHKKIDHNKYLASLRKFNQRIQKYEELLPFVYKRIFGVGDNIVALEQEEDSWSYYHLIRQEFLNEQPFDKLKHHNHRFTEGSLKVRRKDKWGIIDTLGKEFIPIKYKSASQFHKGLAKVTLEGKTLLIDTLGNPINTFSEILFFAHRSPLNRFRHKAKEGLIDLATGKIILPAQYDKIQYQSNRAWHSNRDFIDRRVAKTYKNGKIGLVNFEGKEIAPPIYEHISIGPSIGYPTWFITKEGKTGLVERDGTMLLEVKYDELKPLKFNELLYRLDGKYGIIQVFDNEIISVQQEKPPIIKDHLHFIPPMFDKLSAGKSTVLAQQKGKWGILKRIGRYTTAEFAVKPQFDTCKIYDSYPQITSSLVGFVGVKKNGKWGLYDENYQLIQAITLDKAPHLIQGYFEIEENGERRILDFYGNLLPKNIQTIQPISKYYSKFQSDSRKWGILQNGNQTQKPIILHPAEFDRIRKDLRYENFLYVQKDDIRGFYDLQSNHLSLDQTYDKFQLIEKQYVIIHQSDKPSIYDLTQQKMIASQVPYQFIYPIGIEGIAGVVKDNKWGLLHLETLQEIVPLQYIRINSKNKNEQNHWIVELVNQKLPNAYAVLDETGKLLINPIEGHYFKREHNGNYGIFSNDEYIVFNPKGNIIKRKPFKTKFGSPNLQAVQMADTQKWGFVNAADSLILPPIFDEVRQTPNQAIYFDYLYDVKKDGQWGKIDKLGKAQFPPIPYETMTEFSSNCFRVKHLGKFGLMDSSHAIIAKIQLEEIKKQTDSILVFQQAGKWGFMDYNGNLLLAPQFTNYMSFYDGMAIVQNSSGKSGVVNPQGEMLIPCIYDTIEVGDKNTILQKAKWIKCHSSNSITYFDTKGKKIFSSNHLETHLISHTLAAVKNTKNNQWGLRNLQTKKWIFRPIFDQYQPEGNTIYSFQLSTKMAYINRKGKYIWKEKGFTLLE